MVMVVERVMYKHMDKEHDSKILALTLPRIQFKTIKGRMEF